MTAQALYDTVDACYSSPASAALGRLLLPYLFPELSAFATVEDLVSHLRASDARYRTAVPAEFLDKNQPPMFITLYFIVTRLPDSLRSVQDHFLSLDPTSLTVNLLEQHLLAAETIAVAVGAARGTPRPRFFEGCSPSPLAPSYASAAAADVSVAEDVGAASASVKRRTGKGKGGKGGGGGSGGGGGGSESSGGGCSGGGGGGVTGGGSGGSGGGGGGSGGSGGGGGSGTGGSGTGARRVREWFLHGASGGRCPYVIRTGDRAYLLRSRIAIFDLDFDAILSTMYALSGSAEGDCYRCVLLDPGIEVAALSASDSGTLPGTTPAQALHTFTQDSGASACFFRDSTTLTPLSTPIPVRLADPTGGPVVARSSTVLPCLAVPSGSLSGLHLPSFSANLVSTAALQDAMVTTTTPGGQRVTICSCTRMGHHLATFTRRPGSNLYTLATEPPQVAASAQVSASGQVAASCSCRLLSHQTLLWHHCLGHPSLPRLRGMHSRLLVSGLPRSLPPLPPSPAPPCLPCVEGRQRAAPHSSSFPSTSAPLQTLHMDVWGPARVSGQSRERYFLLVVDDYTLYTTVFPLRSKGQVVDVLIPWIRTVRLQLRERFGQDLPVLRLHSDRGGEFSSNLLRDFCRGEGILKSFTLPDSPHQNGFAERRIGLVMEVARTSMIHAAAPHFPWPFAVRYAAHQLNLWPRVSLPKTSPTLRWTGEVGDASVFQVWGSRAFVRDTSADKLSPHAIPCDVTFDESVPFYRLFPYRSAPPSPPPLFLAPGPPPVAVGSGAARGAPSGGAASRGAEPRGAESEGAETGGAEPRGVETEGGEPGGAEPEGVEPGGAASEVLELLALEVLELLLELVLLERTGAGDHTESEATGAGGFGVGGAGAGGAEVGGTGAGVDGVGGPGVGGAGAGGARAVDPGGAVRPRPYFVPLLQQVLGTRSSTGLTPPLLCPPPDQTQPPLQPASPLPAPSPYSEQSSGLTERREPASRPISLVRTARRVPRSRPPPVPGTHAMALRHSSVPLRVPLPPPPESSLPEVPDPESDRAHAASPTVSCLLATAVTDPSFESAAASALVAELLDFAAACYSDAPDIPTPRSYAEAITGPYSSQWQAAIIAEMASWKSTGTYVDEVPPPGANIVDGMWIFRVKRPPSSPPAFKARYVARGFRQPALGDLAAPPTWLHWVVSCRYLVEPPAASLRSPQGASRVARHTEDYTSLGFAPATADPSLFLRTDTSLPPFYVLVHSLSAPPSDESVEPSGLYPDLVGCLMYLMTCIRPDLAYPLSLLSRYVAPGRHRKVHRDVAKRVLRYLCSTSGMGLVLGGRGPVVLTGHANASWVDDSATQRSSQGYTFSLGSGSVSWRPTCSSSVLSSSCEAEIYAGAMAANELRWRTYLLTDLGEQPRSPPVLYVDNKAMIALCQEHSLEHRTKHIAVRYFLARELQQCGQLRLAYVASRANTADIFTKALPPADHQRFSIVLGLVPTFPYLLTA
ncbi:unnamed protein product [Closterium sp. NIES-54]